MRAALLGLLLAVADAGTARESFSWTEPKGWAARDDWDSAVPVYAVTDGSSRLSVTLYAAGNPLFAGLKAYRAHRLAAKGGAGKPRRVMDARTAAGTAEVWEQDYDEAASGVHGAGRAPRPMRERFALLERDGSLWVVALKAPRAAFERAAKDYAAALASFRPN